MTDIALPARVVRRLWDHVLTALPRLVDWLTVGGFERAVEASVRHRFRAGRPTETEITRYLESLNAPDLALATACLGSSEEAWSHVMLELRPGLYRAARALTRDEAAGRQLADALWTELYGVGTTKNSVEPGTEARPLLVYYHGRSALATWLHSVLAQRHVDSVRRTRRLEPLDTGDAVPEPTTAREPVDPDRAPLRQAFEGALDTALRELAPNDRLRVALYYAQGLRLAQIGRITGEHEATVSRALSRVRTQLRRQVERALSETYGLDERETATCYRDALDEGTFDLTAAVGETLSEE